MSGSEFKAFPRPRPGETHRGVRAPVGSWRVRGTPGFLGWPGLANWAATWLQGKDPTTSSSLHEMLIVATKLKVYYFTIPKWRFFSGISTNQKDKSSIFTMYIYIYNILFVSCRTTTYLFSPDINPSLFKQTNSQGTWQTFLRCCLMSCFFGAEENKIFTYTNQINIQVFLIEKKAEGKLKAANHPSFFGCEKKSSIFGWRKHIHPWNPFQDYQSGHTGQGRLQERLGCIASTEPQ